MEVGGESEVKQTFFNMGKITCLSAEGYESEKKKIKKERTFKAMFLSRQEWI